MAPSRRSLYNAALLFCLFAVGCSVHRIDIQQGNVIDPQTQAQLKLGMTPEQVQFLLGTPLIVDPFHASRWDYIYYRREPGKPPEDRRLTLIFADNKLVRIIGGVTEAIPGIAPNPPTQNRTDEIQSRANELAPALLVASTESSAVL